MYQQYKDIKVPSIMADQCNYMDGKMRPNYIQFHVFIGENMIKLHIKLHKILHTMKTRISRFHCSLTTKNNDSKLVLGLCWHFQYWLLPINNVNSHFRVLLRCKESLKHTTSVDALLPKIICHLAILICHNGYMPMHSRRGGWVVQRLDFLPPTSEAAGLNLRPGASCWKVGSYLPMPGGLLHL